MAANREDRSLGELFRELTHESTLLVKKELELVKAELSEKTSQVGTSITELAIGGGVAYAGLLVLLGAVVLLLGEVMRLWVAALIVGVVVGAIGYMLIQRGLNNMKARNLTPRRAAHQLRRESEHLRERRDSVAQQMHAESEHIKERKDELAGRRS